MKRRLTIELRATSAVQQSGWTFQLQGSRATLSTMSSYKFQPWYYFEQHRSANDDAATNRAGEYAFHPTGQHERSFFSICPFQLLIVVENESFIGQRRQVCKLNATDDSSLCQHNESVLMKRYYRYLFERHSVFVRSSDDKHEELMRVNL